MRARNGGEGSIGENYVVIWKTEEFEAPGQGLWADEAREGGALRGREMASARCGGDPGQRPRASRSFGAQAEQGTRGEQVRGGGLALFVTGGRLVPNWPPRAFSERMTTATDALAGAAAG